MGKARMDFSFFFCQISLSLARSRLQHLGRNALDLYCTYVQRIPHMGALYRDYRAKRAGRGEISTVLCGAGSVAEDFEEIVNYYHCFYQHDLYRCRVLNTS